MLPYSLKTTCLQAKNPDILLGKAPFWVQIRLERTDFENRSVNSYLYNSFILCGLTGKMRAKLTFSGGEGGSFSPLTEDFRTSSILQ
jgi:hypothetical protein